MIISFDLGQLLTTNGWGVCLRAMLQLMHSMYTLPFPPLLHEPIQGKGHFILLFLPCSSSSSSLFKFKLQLQKSFPRQILHQKLHSGSLLWIEQDKKSYTRNTHAILSKSSLHSIFSNKKFLSAVRLSFSTKIIFVQDSSAQLNSYNFCFKSLNKIIWLIFKKIIETPTTLICIVLLILTVTLPKLDLKLLVAYPLRDC